MYNEKSSREKRKLLQSKDLHDHVCGMCIDEGDMLQYNCLILRKQVQIRNVSSFGMLLHMLNSKR